MHFVILIWYKFYIDAGLNKLDCCFNVQIKMKIALTYPFLANNKLFCRMSSLLAVHIIFKMYFVFFPVFVYIFGVLVNSFCGIIFFLMFSIQKLFGCIILLSKCISYSLEHSTFLWEINGKICKLLDNLPNYFLQ